MTPRLDRIARTAIEGCVTVRELVDKGVIVRVLNMGTVENTPMGRMILTVMFAMAEYDRDMIVERLASARAVAKQTKPDYHEGRKRLEIDEDEFLEKVNAVEANTMSKREAARRLGIGDATFRRRMEEYNAA